jgi:hypothetical protein
MKKEISFEEILNFLENNNLTVKQTRIYLVDVEPHGIWKNLMGVFYPRFLEGYIFYSDDREKIKATYLHELSHGAFFENITVGREIQRLDKKLYELEKELFDGKIQNIIIITSDNVSKSKKLGRNIYEVNHKIFQTYINAAKILEELHKKYSPIIESFALIVCEEYFKRKMEIPNEYQSYYNNIRNRGKLKEIVKYLYQI